MSVALNVFELKRQVLHLPNMTDFQICYQYIDEELESMRSWKRPTMSCPLQLASLELAGGCSIDQAAFAQLAFCL